MIFCRSLGSFARGRFELSGGLRCTASLELSLPDMMVFHGQSEPRLIPLEDLGCHRYFRADVRYSRWRGNITLPFRFRLALLPRASGYLKQYIFTVDCLFDHIVRSKPSNLPYSLQATLFIMVAMYTVFGRQVGSHVVSRPSRSSFAEPSGAD